MMKWSAIILLAALISGCTSHQANPPNPIPDTYSSLDDWQWHASKQVLIWVTNGTPAADAQHTMEQHGFTTITNSPNSLESYYRSSGSWKNPSLECIDVQFGLTNGKVATEQVRTSLKGS